jgi:hypothetical protein
MNNKEKLYLAKQAGNASMEEIAQYLGLGPKPKPVGNAPMPRPADQRDDVVVPSKPVSYGGQPVDAGSLAGIQAAGTPEDHSALQASMGSEGFEDHPDFQAARAGAESTKELAAGQPPQSESPQSESPWYTNPYVLGGLGLGGGALGAYALSRGDDEEEEEEAYA